MPEKNIDRKSSRSLVRRLLRAEQVLKRFVAIEMHPAIYISFIAINICVCFGYRELFHAFQPVTEQHSSYTVAKETVSDAVPLAAALHLVAQQSASQTVAKPDASGTVAKKPPAPAEETIVNKTVEKGLNSSGAAIAKVSSPTGRKKKSRRSYGSGLVPPPPPGVEIVPPPPDAPSLISYSKSFGKAAMLVPPPPPMMADGMAGFDPYLFPVAASHRSAQLRKPYHGKISSDQERVKIVRSGAYKQFIVSR